MWREILALSSLEHVLLHIDGCLLLLGFTTRLQQNFLIDGPPGFATNRAANFIAIFVESV